MAYPAQFSRPAATTPPRLHWGFVLVLNIITFGFFGAIWLVVQSVWAKRMTGNGKALAVAIVNACVLPLFFVSSVVLGVVDAATGHTADAASQLTVLTQGCFKSSLSRLTSGNGLHVAFTARRATRCELPLGGAATFFFGPIYFQYHLSDYVLPEITGVAAEPPAYVPAIGQGTAPLSEL